MFFNFKFSIFKAYKTSFKINYQHVVFYLSWYAIFWGLSLVTLVGLGIYADILNWSVMIQNYNWVISSFKHQLTTFFMGFKYQDTKITEFSFYQFLQLFVSKDILNSALSTMSIKEYFNVVLLSKKIGLVPVLMLYVSFIMAVSIGYVKTALKFQNNKKATLYDMYQYIYLLPQYFLGKLLMFLSFLLWIVVIILFVRGYFIFVAPLNLANKYILVGVIMVAGIAISLFLSLLTVMYQRLRFIKYFIIDKEVTALQACKLSWNLAQGSVISLFLFSLVTILVAVVHPMSGLFIMLAGWLNQQAEVSLYSQMIEAENK